MHTHNCQSQMPAKHATQCLSPASYARRYLIVPLLLPPVPPVLCRSSCTGVLQPHLHAVHAHMGAAWGLC